MKKSKPILLECEIFDEDCSLRLFLIENIDKRNIIDRQILCEQHLPEKEQQKNKRKNQQDK